MPKLNKEQKYDDLLLHVGKLEKIMIERKTKLQEKKDITPEEAYEIAYLTGYIQALSIIDMNICIKDTTEAMILMNRSMEGNNELKDTQHSN